MYVFAANHERFLTRRVTPEMETWNSSYPPYLPEAKTIGSVRGEIRSHELEIESSLEEIRRLEERVAFLRKEVLHKMAFIAPIRRLPPELLSQIFVEYAYNAEGSPWDLIFVCRLWKEMAFDTALLWAKILYQDWPFPSRDCRLEGREVCNVPLRLKKTLERTKNAPLDIKIEAHLNMDTSAGRQILELLSGTMSQWYRIDFCALELPSSVPYFLGDLSSLVEARLWPSVPPLMKSMEVSATSLRRLIVGQDVEFYKYAANPRWTQLTHLTFHDNGYTEPGKEMLLSETYSKMLATCTQLQVLHVRATSWVLPATSFPPSLCECTFWRSGVTLSQAHFPRLTSLYLDDHVSFPREAVHFPELYTLEFIGASGLGGLAMFSAPTLHTMKINCLHKKQDIGRLWGREGEAANSLLPRVLHLRKVLVNSNVIVSALRVLRDLEELYLSASPVGERQDFYRSFFPSKRTKRLQILGPKLKTLVVDIGTQYFQLSRLNLQQERALWDAMVKMAVQRKAKEMEIDTFRFRAARLFDMEWVDVGQEVSPKEFLKENAA